DADRTRGREEEARLALGIRATPGKDSSVPSFRKAPRRSRRRQRRRSLRSLRGRRRRRQRRRRRRLRHRSRLSLGVPSDPQRHIARPPPARRGLVQAQGEWLSFSYQFLLLLGEGGSAGRCFSSHFSTALAVAPNVTATTPPRTHTHSLSLSPSDTDIHALTETAQA
ncbi:mCG145953, partial [Mus musculus]